MTSQEYQEKLQWVDDHFDIDKNDPLFDTFVKTVEEIEAYEQSTIVGICEDG